MAEETGYEIEVLGTCNTNNRTGSVFSQGVEYSHLWSYAQEEALVAVSEQRGDQCWHLITDPERRAKRIAARYADLYFKSQEKTGGKLQLYWTALAAFVVKDIVEAFRFTREEVLNGHWLRTNPGSEFFDPYDHAMRTYGALAKGNLWLFMDIYPWMWFVLEYGFRPGDKSVIDNRFTAAPLERNWSTFQNQAKTAVDELPFARNWLGRLQQQLNNDETYAHAKDVYDRSSIFAETNADRAVRTSAHINDTGYRMPPGRYWRQFDDAYDILKAERNEYHRIVNDTAALARLESRVKPFLATGEITTAFEEYLYQTTLPRDNKDERVASMQSALVTLARQEQINVLQPLIYDDPLLKETLDTNHSLSRRLGGWASPPFQVVFSAEPSTDDDELKAVFDPPEGVWDRAMGSDKSLTDPDDRMAFVAKIAERFNYLMATRPDYMESEIRKIQQWLNA